MNPAPQENPRPTGRPSLRRKPVQAVAGEAAIGRESTVGNRDSTQIAKYESGSSVVADILAQNLSESLSQGLSKQPMNRLFGSQKKESVEGKGLEIDPIYVKENKRPTSGDALEAKNGARLFPSAFLGFTRDELDQLPTFPDEVLEKKTSYVKKKRVETGERVISIPFVHPDRSQEKARYRSSSARKNGFIPRDPFFSLDTWD